MNDQIIIYWIEIFHQKNGAQVVFIWSLFSGTTLKWLEKVFPPPQSPQSPQSCCGLCSRQNRGNEIKFGTFEPGWHVWLMFKWLNPVLCTQPLKPLTVVRFNMMNYLVIIIYAISEWPLSSNSIGSLLPFVYYQFGCHSILTEHRWALVSQSRMMLMNYWKLVRKTFVNWHTSFWLFITLWWIGKLLPMLPARRFSDFRLVGTRPRNPIELMGTKIPSLIEWVSRAPTECRQH